MIRKFKLPDNGIPIRVGQSSFIYKDVYHPIEWHGGEPYRPRVETLVLTKTGKDMIYMERKEGNHYRIPGGSIDADSTFEQQAENETNEEALLKVQEVAFANVMYHQEMDRDYIAKGGDSCVPYVGSITHVYTAYWAGEMVDKSTIEEKDLDDKMAKNGKFYPIMEVKGILREEHIKALINSGRIRDKKLEALLYRKLDEYTVNQSASTIFETPTITAGEMETKFIYHGSIYDFDTFHPMSLDLGNAEQEPGWSTFCFKEYSLARRFALMRMVQKYMDGKEGPMYKCNWDLQKGKPYLHHTVYAEVMNAIKDEKCYVYTIDATSLELGIGNDERFPEVTFREDNVVPYRKDVVYTDEDTIMDDITIIKESPNSYEKRQMDSITNLNRGWVSCMLNRDYSGDSAVAKLTKAVSDGKLKPGDDVVAYMNENGIQLQDISFIERLQDTKVEEGFNLSENFEETIYLGDHKALITSEKKTGSSVYDYNEDIPKQERFKSIDLPDVNEVQRAFLYEIGDRGDLTCAGYYSVFELGIMDEDFIYKPQKYLLQLMVYPPYRELGIGSVLLGYVIRYHKTHFSQYDLAAEVPDVIWKISGIRKWIKTFTTKPTVRGDSSVLVILDNIEDIATESCEQNLSNLAYYHAEFSKSGFNPKIAGGWDEELYSKTIDHALKQAFMSAVAKDKTLLDQKKFSVHMYTAGEEFSSIYLGKVTMYYYGLEKNGYIPNFDWEWEEQEDFSDAFLSNLKEEVHARLMESLLETKEYLVPPYINRGTKKLSQFQRIKANYSTIEKYRGCAKVLTWIEPKNVDDGCIWLDNGKFVGVCTVEKNLLDRFTEITALEVSDEYRGYGIGGQILDYAVNTLKGNALMVEANNAPAITMYQNHGFKVSKGSFQDVYNRLRHTYFMYLPSAIPPKDKDFADTVRIGADPVVENVDLEIVTDSDVEIEDVTTEGMADSLLEPIFIICTFTGTKFGKLVTKIQDCKFSHSGIAMEPDLKTIYTYNMLSKLTGGAGIESIDKYKNVSTGGPGDVCVMCFFVPKTVKEKIEATINYVFSNINNTMYGFGNLINILRNRAVDTGNSLKMVCSQFVDYCLKMANIDLTKKSSNLVSPNDFASIPKKNPKVFVLFDGKNTEYDSKKTTRKIHKLLRNREPKELNVVAEGVELLEACKNIDEARRFVRDVGRLAKKYDANYFIVTDGASGTSNKGNPAVKHARDSQIEWEKKHGFDPDEDWTELYESTTTLPYTPVEENVIFNKDNMGYNLDKFESGKSNILLVTGLSGSGKSTIAEKMAKEYKAEWIELDIFEQCSGFTDDSLKEAGEVFYEYLSAHKPIWDRLKNKTIKGKELGDEIKKFVKYCISWCKKRDKQKWVIEGVQIYSMLSADEVKNYPLIIMGTSMKNSVLQRFKRNAGGGDIEWGAELKNEFSNLIKWYWDEEKTLKMFREEVKAVSEFVLPEQGDFDAYRDLADLDSARDTIPSDVMEGWFTALMEAKKKKEDDDGLPSLGKDDKTEDYTSDAEEDEEDEEGTEDEEEDPDNEDAEGEEENPEEDTDDEEDTNDYTADAEDDEDEDPEEEPAEDETPDDEEEDSNDYTQDADEGEDEEPAEEEPKEEEPADDPAPANDTGNDDAGADDLDAGGTDYTADTGTDDAGGDTGADAGRADDLDAGGTDYTDDAASGGGDDTGEDSGDADTDSGDESSDTGSDEKNDTQSGNNGVKNYTLLTDFESLYRLASEISDTIESITMEKPIQNSVLTQVRSNLSAIKESIMQFITTHFKAGDYAFNLYYYEIFIGLLSKNLEILKKNREFSEDKRSKKKETNKE